MDHILFGLDDVVSGCTSFASLVAKQPSSLLVGSLQYLAHESSFVAALFVLFWIIFLSWFLSVLNDEYSMVDRLWSITPFLFCWVFVLHPVLVHGESLNVRGAHASLLATLWGLRLTWNFARKGGYTFHVGEDYRWVIVKTWFSPAAFQIFNVVFIAVYQHVLLFLLTVPVFIITKHFPVHTLTGLDALIGIVHLAVLAAQTLADNQQWDFQTRKHATAVEVREGEFLDGFLQSGFFSVSRHPAFFCEQFNWFVVASFLSISTGHVLNWSLIGPLLLVGIFLGSTPLTESISAKKYSEYANYQSKVPMLVPFGFELQRVSTAFLPQVLFIFAVVAWTIVQ